ncbi:MAG: jacalin-like lectin [Bacteroidota bacterium]
MKEQVKKVQSTEEKVEFSKFGPAGGVLGTNFDDSDLPFFEDSRADIFIHEIHVWVGPHFIRGIQIDYEVNGQSHEVIHGKEEGEKKTYTPHAQNHLIEIRGTSQQVENKGFSVIESLEFLTNDPNDYSDVFGYQKGRPFRFSDIEGMQILGFWGAAGGNLDAIGACYTKI